MSFFVIDPDAVWFISEEHAKEEAMLLSRKAPGRRFYIAAPTGTFVISEIAEPKVKAGPFPCELRRGTASDVDTANFVEEN